MHPKLGFLLFIVGLMCVMTPSIAFGKGDTDDAFINMMNKLPLEKFMVIRMIVLTGVFFIVASLVVP